MWNNPNATHGANEKVHPPGPLQRRGVARNKNAAPVEVHRLECNVWFGSISIHGLVPNKTR